MTVESASIHAILLLLLASLTHADEAGFATDKVTIDRSPILTVAPVYPEKARKNRIEGAVKVCYHIDKRGRPYQLAVRTSTHRIFERPAMAAVRASTYVPLAPGEKSPGIKTCRTFRFSLEPVQDA